MSDNETTAMEDRWSDDDLGSSLIIEEERE